MSSKFLFVVEIIFREACHYLESEKYHCIVCVCVYVCLFTTPSFQAEVLFCSFRNIHVTLLMTCFLLLIIALKAFTLKSPIESIFINFQTGLFINNFLTPSLIQC